MPSTVIRAFHYQPEEHALDVTFVSGRRYRYLNVPDAVHRQMREAFSKGEFFNIHIKNHFSFQRMDS
jgi:hypothetical protein